MISIANPQYPKKLKMMKPELLALDAGYSENNLLALKKLAVKHIDNKTPEEVLSVIDKSTEESDFYDFFVLYDFLIKKDRKARASLEEVGYSPYNFLLLINCLGQDKRSIAKLLDWSFSKVSVNTAIRTSDHFMPMVGTQWQDFLNYFVSVLRLSDEEYSIERDYNKIFYMIGDKEKPLKIPE